MINMRRSSAKSVAKIINRQGRGGAWGAPKKGQQMATCKSCGAAMKWAKTANGKIIPLDAQPTTDGTMQLTASGIARVVAADMRTGLELYMPHHVTCPFRDQHRREK